MVRCTILHCLLCQYWSSMSFHAQSLGIHVAAQPSMMRSQSLSRPCTNRYARSSVSLPGDITMSMRCSPINSRLLFASHILIAVAPWLAVSTGRAFFVPKGVPYQHCLQLTSNTRSCLFLLWCWSGCQELI